MVESFGVGGAVTVLGDKDSDYDIQNYDLIVIGILFRPKKNVSRPSGNVPSRVARHLPNIVRDLAAEL